MQGSLELLEKPYIDWPIVAAMINRKANLDARSMLCYGGGVSIGPKRLDQWDKGLKTCSRLGYQSSARRRLLCCFECRWLCQAQTLNRGGE